MLNKVDKQKMVKVFCKRLLRDQIYTRILIVRVRKRSILVTFVARRLSFVRNYILKLQVFANFEGNFATIEETNSAIYPTFCLISVA